MLSAVLGISALHSFYQENLIFIVMLAILVFPLLTLTHSKCRGRAGVSVCVVTLVYLLTWLVDVLLYVELVDLCFDWLLC